MNILELCLSPGLGGLELYVFRSAQALANNHNVIAVLNVKGKLTDYFREHSSIRSTHLDKSFKHLPLLNARKLARLIDSEDIDAVHMHWGNDLALAALAKKMSSKKPALIYTRQMKITRYKNDLYHRSLYREMDLMLTITRQLESEAKMYIPVDENRITTLYYGVSSPEHIFTTEERNNQRKQLGFHNNDFVIGLLGRLEESKGQHLLIEALRIAKSENIDLKALIVGHEMNKGYRKMLRDLSKSKALAQNIVFLDFVSSPQELMQLCDCIVLASKEETFGLVLPEAMRCGVAVIGSNSGGVPEIIEHMETGLLFNSGDSEDLYKQLHLLHANPDLKTKLALHGYNKANQIFNSKSHYLKLEQIIMNQVSHR